VRARRASAGLLDDAQAATNSLCIASGPHLCLSASATPSSIRGTRGRSGVLRTIFAWTLLAAVMMSAMPFEIAAAQAARVHEDVAQSDSSVPCSEHGPADPCEDGCLCPCCPAHTLAPQLHPTLAFAEHRVAAQKWRARPHQPLGSDFTDELFRPPRRA